MQTIFALLLLCVSSCAPPPPPRARSERDCMRAMRHLALSPAELENTFRPCGPLPATAV